MSMLPPKKNDQSVKSHWSLRRKTDEEIIRLTISYAITLPKHPKGLVSFYIGKFYKLLQKVISNNISKVPFVFPPRRFIFALKGSKF